MPASLHSSRRWKKISSSLQNTSKAQTNFRVYWQYPLSNFRVLVKFNSSLNSEGHHGFPTSRPRSELTAAVIAISRLVHSIFSPRASELAEMHLCFSALGKYRGQRTKWQISALAAERREKGERPELHTSVYFIIAQISPLSFLNKRGRVEQ